MINKFLSQMFNQGTEPTFGGLRMPRQRMGDDSRMIRQTNPQERYREDVMGRRAEEGDDTLSPKQQAMQGAITGAGGILASMFEQEPERPLEFAQMRQSQFMPIQDPRFLRYAGGRKRGGSVPVGSFVNVHDDEKVVNLGNGEVEVIPKTRKKGDNWDVESVTETVAEIPTSVTEEVTEEVPVLPKQAMPSNADRLRTRIEDVQGRDYSRTKGEDGVETYGKDYDKKRNWKDALRAAGYGLVKSLASAPPTNDLGALLGRAIGGAGTGAVMGATMDNVDEKMRDEFKIAQLMPQYKEAYGMERQKKADDLQAENTRFDNELNKMRVDNAQTAKADAEAGKALTAIPKLKYFNPNDPAHAALAKRAGLNPTDLKGWDDRRPFTKNVAGVEYVYKDGKFEPSNLPTDEAKTLKDYVVEMPNGEKRTYKVSQKDAANFSTQMSALGARLAQQESQFNRRIKLDEMKFAQAKKEFETQSMFRQQAFTALEAARAAGNAQDAAKYQLELDKYDMTLQKMQQAMLEAKNKGELDDEQFNQLDTFFKK